MRLDELGLAVHAGDGLVGRFPGVVFCVVGADAGGRSHAEELLRVCRAAPDDRAQRLPELLDAIQPASGTSFCVLTEQGPGITVYLLGDAEAVVFRERGRLRLSAAEDGTWTQETIAGSFRGVWVGCGDPEPGAERLLDLVEGVVPGRGIVLHEREAPRQAAAATTPAVGAGKAGPAPSLAPAAPGVPAEPGPVAPPRAPGMRFEAISLLDVAPDTPREPLAVVTPTPAAAPTAASDPAAATEAAGGPALVDGILCTRQHFNHPAAAYCAVCGISMAQRTHYLIKGPRPPLGMLALDDGSAYTLDTGYVIGRDPTADPAVAEELARPLVVQDREQSVSGIHAEIRLDGWEVVISDRDSANGTYVHGPSDGEWVRLKPRSPVQLVPGSNVAIGGRMLTYYSHRAS